MSVGGLKPCCATGSLHTGAPTGEVSKLHGFDTYIAVPPGGVEAAKGIVVVLPDIFGWTFPNNRILADDYARKGGFSVLLPDFMDGCVVPSYLAEWLSTLEATGPTGFIKKLYAYGLFAYHIIPFFWSNTQKKVHPGVIEFFRGLKISHPNLPVGAAGFCWGGLYTLKLCSAIDRATPPVSQAQPQSPGQSGGTGEPLVVCGFTAHPSMLSYPASIEAVELPLSVAAAGRLDPQMSREQGELTREILEKKTQSVDGAQHEFIWYEGATHGFAVRADENDVEEAQRGKQAEAQAIRWFTKWFAAAGKA
ncbi:hypothetical protein AAFC00_004905 [Neodothiora populina]|uniref:Dienelactone hydrolase domain-containing protein n=1 Tax=Neodothiora populina TaxID=2781224 RepID=A0ABR3P502_9PEZI